METEAAEAVRSNRAPHHGGEGAAALLVQARSLCCALPLSTVIEQMRPQPVVPFSGQPSFLLGVSIIRGEPTPVVDLGALVGGERAAQSARFVTVRTIGGQAALAVDAVHGLRTMDLRTDRFTELVRRIGDGTVTALAAFDAKLLAVLDTARIVPDDVRRTLNGMRT